MENELKQTIKKQKVILLSYKKKKKRILVDVHILGIPLNVLYIKIWIH